MIHRREFVAHRFRNPARVEQAAERHGSGDGEKSPAQIERRQEEKQRDDFWRVV